MIKIKIPAGGSWPWQSPGDPHHIDPEGPNWWDIDPALRALKCYVAVHPPTPNESLIYWFWNSINISAAILFLQKWTECWLSESPGRAFFLLPQRHREGIGPKIFTSRSGLTDWYEFGDALQKLNTKDLWNFSCKSHLLILKQPPFFFYIKTWFFLYSPIWSSSLGVQTELGKKPFFS